MQPHALVAGSSVATGEATFGSTVEEVASTAAGRDVADDVLTSTDDDWHDFVVGPVRPFSSSDRLAVAPSS